jgi:hypothetical protein
MSSICEALIDSFGISTCILEDSLPTVLVTLFTFLLGSKFQCNGNIPLFLSSNWMAGLFLQKGEGLCLGCLLIRMHYPTRDRHM